MHNNAIMIVTPIKIRVLIPPQDDLLSAVRQSVKKIPEKSILVVTSKVVSIWQGRCVPISQVPHKDELIAREADVYLPRSVVPNAWCMHTIKDNVLIPSAGIDESNAAKHYILWPKNPNQVAKELWTWVRKTYHVHQLGIIITDSHSIPLRRGVVGISLGHYGFLPLHDYRGTADLFGRKLTSTLANIPDSLAAAAVFTMGEGKESTPLCLIEQASSVVFVLHPSKSKKPYSSFHVSLQEDLYYPLFAKLPWKSKKKS